MRRWKAFGKRARRRPLYLIAEPRSGSSWLMHTLTSHKKIRLDGERLNPTSFPDSLRFRDISADLFPECVAYLEKETFRPDILWSGCKVLIPHLFQVNERFPEYFISRIQEMGGRCLLLTRRNLLAARLSLAISFQTGCWHVTRSEKPKVTPLRLDPDAVWRGMDRSWSRRDAVLNILKARRIDFLHLNYEDIFPKARDSLRQVAHFLDIMDRGFRLHDEVRANPYPLNQLLLNYSEVVDRLRKDARFNPYLPGADDGGVSG